MRLDILTTIKKKHLLASCLALCLFVLSAGSISQVYKFVDEHGNVTYSDTPPADKQDMEPAELPEIFYQPGVEIPEKPLETETLARNIKVSITSPVDGATILGSNPNFRASASTSERLISGDTARLIVNGVPQSNGQALSWTVTDLIRGDYHLSVEIVDKDQKIIGQSEPVLVYVQRNIAR